FLRLCFEPGGCNLQTLMLDIHSLAELIDPEALDSESRLHFLRIVHIERELRAMCADRADLLLHVIPDFIRNLRLTEHFLTASRERQTVYRRPLVCWHLLHSADDDSAGRIVIRMHTEAWIERVDERRIHFIDHFT